MSIAEDIYRTPGQHTYDDVEHLSCVLPSVLDRLKHFRFRDDDVIVASYPKSGTTWVQACVDLVHSGGDFDTASKVDLDDKFPFIEMTSNDVCKLDILEQTDSPRLIKTHMPHSILYDSLLNCKCKIIFVMRNPKDVLVSYYHHYKSSSAFGTFQGTWNDFYKIFLSNKLIYGDVMDYNLEWWNNRNKHNILVLHYEDMKLHHLENVKRIAAFLEKELSDQVLQKIVAHTSFGSMKQNPMVNKTKWPALDQRISPFIRKGEVGDWKNWFTVAQSKRFDQYYAEKIKGSDIKLQFE